jgi:type IV pilus assembly protein PilC
MRSRNVLAGLLRPGGKGTGKVTPKEFLIFNQELVSLLHAGLPIVTCLDILIERRKNPFFRKSLQDIRDQVRSGAALSEGFAGHPHLFPPIYASTLASGERSGEIESVVRRYIKYTKTVIAVRKKVVSSLMYPALLMLMAVGLVSFLILWVMPKFSSFYEEFGAELPLLTQVLLGVSELTTKNVWALILAAAGGWLALLAWARSETGRVQFDRVKLSVPLVGKVLHKYSIANFSRTLGTLLEGGIPLVQALDIASPALRNQAFRSAVEQASGRVREGHPLWESLERTGVMTDLAIEMVKVGESTGSLEIMLANVADFYDEEIDNDLTTLTSMLEPVMLVFMGFLIAMILLALYLPLLESYSTSRM